MGHSRHQKKKKHESAVNTNGWMISYADMATLLLAMFIAMSTMSQDQTGLAFEQGTGGFRNSGKTFGALEGLLKNSARTVPLKEKGPTFSVEDPTEDPDPLPSQADRTRVIDGEEERLQRFLNALKSQHSTNRLPPVVGQSAVDFYEIRKTAPLLTDAQREKISPLVPLGVRAGYQLEIIVWANGPAERLCAEATIKAKRLSEEIAEVSGLDFLGRRRMVAIGQPWRFRDVVRPAFSLVVVKQREGGEE